MVDSRLIWLVLLIPLVLIIVLGFTYNTVYATPANMQKTKLEGTFPSILTAMGLPDEWMWLPALFYLFIIPFVMIVTIVFGFLREIRIFTQTNGINFILALAIALSTLPLGAFVRMVNTIGATMGMWSVLAFAVMFFVGVFFMTLSRLSGWGVKTKITQEFSQRQSYDDMLANAQRIVDTYRSTKQNTKYDTANKAVQDAMALESQGKIKDAINKLRHVIP